MIVVTGGIACGKSTFVEVAREMAFRVVDADEWYHDEFVGSPIQQHWQKTLFGSVSVKSAAFRHDNWTIYESAVAEAFAAYVGFVRPDICIIPELFKRETFFRVNLPKFEILTIERDNHVDAAIARDTHRSAALTELIYQNQTSSEERVARSQYLLYNTGSKDEFKRSCTKWLKLHLPAAFIPHMRDTSTL